LVITALKGMGVPVAVATRRFSMPRSTFYKSCGKDDKELSDLIIEIAFKHSSYGYRMITALLRRKGIMVNHKKVYRVYRSLGIGKPANKSKKRRYMHQFTPIKALYPGHIWAVDFIHDSIEAGRQVRIFNTLDLFSRRAFEPEIDYSLPGDKIAAHINRLFLRYGSPRIIRRDDGPEFRSKEFQSIMRRWRIREEVIPPGQPSDNGFIESFHGSMREEILDQEIFENLRQARQKILRWINEYNTQRPHSALEYKTPMDVWYKLDNNKIIPKLSHN
jgi:putative transposase